MKHMKKILAVVLAATMVMAMGVTAFADTTKTTYTITMDTTTGHTYGAYQVFTGDLSVDDEGVKTLSNIVWGNGVNGTSLLAALKADTTYGAAFASCTNGKEVAKVLENYENKGSDIEAIAKIIAANKATRAGQGTTSISGLDAGYYLILDETAAADLPQGDTISRFMLEVVADVNVEAKDSHVSSEKKVQDINDTTETAFSALQDSADHDIGDDVPYTLKFTLPADYAKYDHYYVAFQDDMSKGLTYKAGSAKIKYGSADEVAIADPTAGTTTYTGGHMWIWEIMDLKAVAAAANLQAGDSVILTYKATLNADAVVGVEGNPNNLQVEYTSNPNKTGDGTSKPTDTGKTPIDINIVFTYETVFNKVEPDGTGNKPLTGADFKLEKKVGTNWVPVTELHGASGINPIKTVSSSGTSFSFKGLDDGDYKLTETTTPTGYNTIEPIEFTITATHEVLSDNPKLTELKGEKGSEFKMTAITDTNGNPTGELDADILNQKGSVLPATGGIGTTLFYIVGGILVIGAAVVLITRRRMDAQ